MIKVIKVIASCDNCGGVGTLKQLMRTIWKDGHDYDMWMVECADCKKQGPQRFTPVSAVSGWNYRNKPHKCREVSQ